MVGMVCKFHLDCQTQCDFFFPTTTKPHPSSILNSYQEGWKCVRTQKKKFKAKQKKKVPAAHSNLSVIPIIAEKKQFKSA